MAEAVAGEEPLVALDVHHLRVDLVERRRCIGTDCQRFVPIDSSERRDAPNCMAARLRLRIVRVSSSELTSGTSDCALLQQREE